MAPRRPSVTRINLHRRIICTQVPGEAAEGVVPAAGAEPEADGHEQAAHGGERPPAEAGLAARLRERLLPPADAERTRLSLSLSSLHSLSLSFSMHHHLCSLPSAAVPVFIPLLRPRGRRCCRRGWRPRTRAASRSSPVATRTWPRRRHKPSRATQALLGTYAILPLPCQPARAAFAFILPCYFGWPSTVPSNDLYL
jgi:hypothetical protein